MQVLIYNSYAIRDKLRALEFRFDSERRAWVRSVFEVKRLLELEDHADITLDKILALAETVQQVGAVQRGQNCLWRACARIHCPLT